MNQSLTEFTRMRRVAMARLEMCVEPDCVAIAAHGQTRCKEHDNLHRLKTRGQCTGVIDGVRCERGVWANALCPACNTRKHRQDKIARDFTGHPENRDPFVSLMRSAVLHFLPLRDAYVLYLRTGEGGMRHDIAHMQMTLAWLRKAVAPEQYNWLIRQLNDGLTEGDRLPLARED